ncbi:CLUMA_CG008079, isoform A [Clunio marinus]|uniref:CLIP domain-containing serine protease n=1 Tax=Clunio marinus TaxID=568069 RepID=A0A1J1I303_9DIPT|nr:CLUMA_CG008079, isoform A [Clunio marinus]
MKLMKEINVVITTFLIVGFNAVASQSFCRTPGYKMGRCVSIYNCDYLLKILASKSLTQQSISFLKMSQCDGGSSQSVPHVCCARNDDSLIFGHQPDEGIQEKFFKAPSASNNRASVDNEDDSIIYKSSNSLLPKTNECGREKIENRIYSGQNTDKEEFPWLALLEYRKAAGELSINCAGSLISHRYVLTAAHCLTGDIIHRIGNLVNVRLGDYDLSLSRSCPGRHCGNPMRVNEIEEIIPHESFSSRVINRRHDIGLVRLKQPVKFSSLVRPVCLPMPSSPSLKNGESVYITGFGRTLHSKMSTIKQKLRIPMYDHRQCVRKFATKNVDITKDQICAGGEFSRDACDGDSGGPLMRFRDNWIVEGIVSFGYLCGLDDWPAIYTKVSSYTEWIERHIKP